MAIVSNKFFKFLQKSWKKHPKIWIFFHYSLWFQKLKYYFRTFSIWLLTLIAIGLWIWIVIEYKLAVILPTTIGLIAILITNRIYYKHLQLKIFNNKKTLKEIKFTFSKRNLLFHLLKFELIFLFIDNLLTKNNRYHTALTKEATIEFDYFNKMKKTDEDWSVVLNKIIDQYYKGEIIEKHDKYLDFLIKNKSNYFDNLKKTHIELELFIYREEQQRFELSKDRLYKSYDFFWFTFLFNNWPFYYFEEQMLDTDWNKTRYSTKEGDLVKIFEAMLVIRSELYFSSSNYIFDWLNSRENFFQQILKAKKTIQDSATKMINYKTSKSGSNWSSTPILENK